MRFLALSLNKLWIKSCCSVSGGLLSTTDISPPQLSTGQSFLLQGWSTVAGCWQDSPGMAPLMATRKQWQCRLTAAFLRTPAGHATCTLVVPWTPSLQSSVWAPPPQSCSDLRKSSLSSPFFSCCACYTQTVSESHRKVETRPLEKQKFPCTPGLAALCGWMSCIWTSLGPWNSAVLT